MSHYDLIEGATDFGKDKDLEIQECVDAAICSGAQRIKYIYRDE